MRTITMAAGAAVALLALAGCSAATTTTQTAPTTAATRAPGGGSGDAPRDRGGVSGLIADAQDQLLQVQGDGEQTAVRYTADTTVRKTTTVDASAIAVGDCIVAVTAQDADAATTITVTDAASDGTCTGGFGGPGRAGGRPGGTPTDAPSGVPAGGPQGGGAGFGRLTTGAVTAVGASAITVETTDRDGSTSTADVALGTDTTVTATADATTADIAKGLCVTAMGTADDSGGYDATALTLSAPAADGTCSMGFGGFGGRPGGQNDQGGSDG